MGCSTRSIRLILAAASLFILSFTACKARPAAHQLFDGNWDDLSVYKAGLVNGEERSLEILQGVTIYHLDIVTAPDLRNLTGREEVRYTNRETVDLDAIYFQLFPNVSGGSTTVSAVTVDDRNAEFSYSNNSSVVRVDLPQALQTQDAVTIQLDFKVEIPESGGSFGLFGYSEGVLALDSFYPVIPAYDAEGWRMEQAPPYGDKTNLDASFYLVRVHAPANLVFAASGSEIQKEITDNEQTVVFASGPARDFYLTASSLFTKVSTTVKETTINSYSVEQNTDNASRALAVAESSMRSFNKRFGDYPYTELDIVPLRMEDAGGIEYPGVIGINADIYGEDDILESVVAHEVGHQWFYNVIGNDQVNEPWLDEAMAQYLTGMYYLDRYGKIGWRYYRETWVSGWASIGFERIPISQPVRSYNRVEYSAIVYSRGPLFIAALGEEMGEQTFETCLRGYYQSNKWQIVTTQTFIKHFESCSPSDLTELFQRVGLPLNPGSR